MYFRGGFLNFIILFYMEGGWGATRPENSNDLYKYNIQEFSDRFGIAYTYYA